MMKTIMRLGLKGVYFNITRIICVEIHKQHHTKWRKPQSILTKIMNMTQMATSLLLLNMVFEVLAISTMAEKRIKANSRRKDERKVTIFETDMILYIGETKDSRNSIADEHISRIQN